MKIIYRKGLVVLAILIILGCIIYYRYYKRDKNTLGKLQRPPSIRLQYSRKIPMEQRPKILTSETVVEVLRRLWSSQIEVREEFVVLLIDRSNRVLGYHKLSIGGITETSVDYTILFAVALKSLATAFILAHNHPSGNLQPSESDIKLTKEIKHIAQIHNINFLDHIIITKEGYYSFTDNGML